VDAKTMAQPALKAVQDGETVFEPKSYEKIYFEWLNNIEPWCVSRQLWWGHQIPAWYGPDGEIFVAETEEEARAEAEAKLGAGVVLTREEDVLDTWFSSALWPFSTMGWPEKTDDLARFYPTADLVTAADIIFFWVARMMMMGKHFMGDAPFKRVIINGLVRDEKGHKMSKSKGNVIDPLEIVDELGADPLRFTMAILSGTRDIKLSKQRIEGYRNFGTKLWNAARFSQMNECARIDGFDPSNVEQTINRWIRGELTKAQRSISEAIEGGRFDDAATALYRYIWNVFCDWYLELAKPVFQGTDEAAKAETRAMTAWVLDETLKLLHPVMPYITEELWAELGKTGPARESLLIGAAWPELPESYIDASAEQEIGWVVDLIGELRGLRAEMNVPPSAKPPLAFVGADDSIKALVERHRPLILTLGRVSEVSVLDAAPSGAVTCVSSGATVALSLADFIDLNAEKARLAKEVAVFESDIGHYNKKLGNPNFVSRAAPEVVEEQRQKLADAEAGKAKLVAALARLEAMA
ncbi:class I tRNA ligase family protein, partial [Brevundimonas sp.]